MTARTRRELLRQVGGQHRGVHGRVAESNIHWLGRPATAINFSRLRNEDITAGMNMGRASPDVEIRKLAYARVQAAFADQIPYLWMQRWRWSVVTTTRVHDAHNVTLPDGSPAMALVAGTHRLTETWIEH